MTFSIYDGFLGGHKPFCKWKSIYFLLVFENKAKCILQEKNVSTLEAILYEALFPYHFKCGQLRILEVSIMKLGYFEEMADNRAGSKGKEVL